MSKHVVYMKVNMKHPHIFLNSCTTHCNIYAEVICFNLLFNCSSLFIPSSNAQLCTFKYSGGVSSFV